MPCRALPTAFIHRLSFFFLLAAVAAAGCNSSEAPPLETADSGTRNDAAPAPPADSKADGDNGSAKTDTTPTDSPDGVKQAAARELPPGSDPLLPAGVTRNSTEGWWRIVFSINSSSDYPQDYSAGFVKIGKTGDGAFQVEEVQTNDIINPAKPVRQEATEKTVHIAFVHEETTFDYTGSLDKNVIRGNLQFESSRQNLVRLMPINETDVTEEALNRQRLGATFGSEEVVSALQSDSPVEKLREVAKTWTTSPVLFMGYDALFQGAADLEIDRATLQEMETEFEAVGRTWGERAEQAASLNIAVDLLLTGYETDFAEQKLEQVRKEAPQLAAHWEDLIEAVRPRGEMAKARRARAAALAAALEQIEQGQTDEGLAMLRRLHKEQPIDPVASYRLAEAERQHGSKEESLRLFARLAALPQATEELGEIAAEPAFTPPRVVAARLFEEQHGSRNGFDDYLMEVYHDGITSFLTDQDRGRQPSGNERTALVELFTGATCPPCVAADVATEAIEDSFPATDVTVLRYHVHNPGPDPLTGPDSVLRNEYYGSLIQGTPTIMLDGEPVEYNVGGPFSNSPVVYRDLAKSLEARTSKPVQATINLAATVSQNALRIQASASSPERPADSLRLRIVIAEDGVRFDAYNGIREHGMVVREMPGGAAGIAAVDGQFQFEQEIPLTEVRSRLLDYLDETETQLSREFGQRFTFDARPLDLRRLNVVAFLQDDATRDVLQSAVVPIEQEIALPPVSEVETSEPEPAGASSDGGPALSPGE